MGVWVTGFPLRGSQRGALCMEAESGGAGPPFPGHEAQTQAT